MERARLVKLAAWCLPDELLGAIQDSRGDPAGAAWLTSVAAHPLPALPFPWLERRM